MIVFLKHEHNIHLMEMQSTESKKIQIQTFSNKQMKYKWESIVSTLIAVIST